MVLFTSPIPDVSIPENLTTWEWLFESNEYSPLYKQATKPLGAYVDAETKERLNWAEVKSKSTALSSHLVRHSGLKPHDTVSIFCNNNIWYPVCMFAVIRAGGRVNGASPVYTIDEMAYALRVAQTKIVFTVPSCLTKVMTAAKQVGIPANKIFLIHGTADGVRSIQELIHQETESRMPSPPYFQLPTGTTNKELCGYLNFSSGTTGLPKAVMISHHNVIAQCHISAQDNVSYENFKILAVMPLFHITGTWRFLHLAILLNGDSIMLPAFSMPAMLKAIVEFHIDDLILVPPILLRLARDPVVSQYDLRHVRRWVSGAAPVSPEVLKELEQRFPWTAFRQGYGATEAPAIAQHPPAYNLWKYGASVGKLNSNTVAKVIDTEGKELGPGQTGEIIVKGPQIVMGYLDNEKATAESFDTNGFYHTGDIGYFDAEGLIYIKDRIKEMIKVKAFQVPPAELEDLLLGHEIVNDCAVVSIPDEYSGELPKAYIVVKPGVQADEVAGRQLLEYVKLHKTRYKWLAEIEFIDTIPKSAAGKLLRRILRDRHRNRDTEKGEPGGLRVQEKARAVSSTSNVVKIKSETTMSKGGIVVHVAEITSPC